MGSVLDAFLHRPSMNDLDAYRAAALLIRQSDDDPEMYAAGRADDMIEKRDMEGLAAWEKILKAIRELQRTTPGEDGGLN